MINQLPTNIIPFFILGASVTIFGLRSLYLYHAKRLPLSLYIGLGALLIGVSDLFYSVPFFFTYNNDILKITALIGDLLYYGSIMVMARLIWYLGFSKKVSFYWVLLPYLILIAGALISTMVSWQTIVYMVTEDVYKRQGFNYSEISKALDELDLVFGSNKKMYNNSY